ncbi:hypothetical protein D3C74_297890 [compost metagenome]
MTSSAIYNKDITFSEVNDILERSSALEYKVTVPEFKAIPGANIDSNLVEKFGRFIEKAIYKTTNHEVDIYSLHKGPFISRLTGITFNNFDYFWSSLERELNHTLNDYHNIHILNVCSLAALLKYLEELGI